MVPSSLSNMFQKTSEEPNMISYYQSLKQTSWKRPLAIEVQGLE